MKGCLSHRYRQSNLNEKVENKIPFERRDAENNSEIQLSFLTVKQIKKI